MQLTATLVADGSSDSLLKPILEWLLSQYLPAKATLPIQVPEWGRLPTKMQTLPQKLLAAQLFFTADIYFIHRDAENYSSSTNAPPTPAGHFYTLLRLLCNQRIPL